MISPDHVRMLYPFAGASLLIMLQKSAFMKGNRSRTSFPQYFWKALHTHTRMYVYKLAQLLFNEWLNNYFELSPLLWYLANPIISLPNQKPAFQYVLTQFPFVFHLSNCCWDNNKNLFKGLAAPVYFYLISLPVQLLWLGQKKICCNLLGLPFLVLI